MKTRLALALISLILPCLTACATGSGEAERAAKMRVTTNPDDVKGCQSLGVVTANGGYEDPVEAIRHAAGDHVGEHPRSRAIDPSQSFSSNEISSGMSWAERGLHLRLGASPTQERRRHA